MKRLAALLLALPLCAVAGEPTQAVDEEARFEEALRDFGYTSGAAWQCSAAFKRAAHEAEVLKAYSGLVRLFGSDRAFFYAAAFGAGTGMAIDQAKCPEYLAEFRQAMKSSGKTN